MPRRRYTKQQIAAILNSYRRRGIIAPNARRESGMQRLAQRRFSARGIKAIKDKKLRNFFIKDTKEAWRKLHINELKSALRQVGYRSNMDAQSQLHLSKYASDKNVPTVLPDPNFAVQQIRSRLSSLHFKKPGLKKRYLRMQSTKQRN